jgi:hypothetical protein
MSRLENTLTADALGLEASCRAKELVVRTAPRARVAFTGDGQVTTEREGIPPSGTQDDHEYEDVSVRVSIRGSVQQPPR